MAGLEGSTHDADVARAVERVVTAAIGHLDQLLHDGLALEVVRVDEIRGAELLGPRLLAGVHIDDDDLGRLLHDGSLDHGQTHAARAEDRDVRALLDLGRLDHGAVARRDAAAQQTRPVHGGVGGDGDDGDVGHDGVLGEGRGAHEVQEVLALALEPRCAIGHDALALGGSNLAAQVRLSGLAELALFTFWRAVKPVMSVPFVQKWLGERNGHLLERNYIVSWLDRRHALADGLYDSRALMAENDGECTLGILPGKRVRICRRAQISIGILYRRDSGSYLCGRRQCNGSGCGPHVPLAGQLRCLR